MVFQVNRKNKKLRPTLPQLESESREEGHDIEVEEWEEQRGGQSTTGT